MKYLEQSKTVVLIILVGLSILLTFSIWSYHPNYEKVEKPEPSGVLMDKKRTLPEIIQPARLLIRQEGDWRGTIDTEEMAPLFTEMKKWQLTDISIVSSNFNLQKLNDQLLVDQRIVLQFDGEVPMPVFQSLLPVTSKKVPEIIFDQVIISWSTEESDIPKNELTILFSNVKQKQLYRGKVKVKSENGFKNDVLGSFQDLASYEPIQRDNANTLFLPTQMQKLTQYKYLISAISIEDFKNALFTMPGIVKMSPDLEAGIDKYTDDKSIMTIDKNRYLATFVDATATENQENIQKSNLIASTFNFINLHGGWTGDYRYANVDYNAQEVVYQLYIENLPVLKTDLGTAKIEAFWGNGRIYRYIRPTYKLAYLPQEENKEIKLISGIDVVQKLMASNEIDFNKITALRVGLTMKQDEGRSSIYLFEPTWFYRLDGVWYPINPKDAQVGGDTDGLE